MTQTNAEWWKSAVIYQIYPRSFCDSNNDGIGDIPGIISKLDYLKELGVDAIWLSPVYVSPNRDYGYDIANYHDINPEYGTLNDMKRLISEAKSRGIRVIMDLVINHTSDQHPWFRASRDKTSPYRDYYIWRKPRKNIFGHLKSPNNWTSYFTGSVWTLDDKSGEYYLHLFTKQQPDLNYHNQAVIDEVKKILKFWLELGVAGFRCDVINLLYKESLKDGKYRLSARGSEHYLSSPGAHKVLEELNRDVLAPYHAFTVGEASHVTVDQAKAFTGGNELSEVFSFDHVSYGFSIFSMIRKLKKATIKWQKSLSWNAIFLENHDQPRAVSTYGSVRYREASAKMLATLLLTLRGTPFIYQGQEIGMIDTKFTSLDQVKDPVYAMVYNSVRKCHLPRWSALSLALIVGRDKVRTPMQWNNHVNAGFSEHDPWLPVNKNFKEVNVKNDLADENSVFHYYQKILQIRKEIPALINGDIEFLRDKRDLLSYKRTLGSETYVIIINLSYHAVQTRLHMQGVTVLDTHRRKLVTGRITLDPYESVVVKLG